MDNTMLYSVLAGPCIQCSAQVQLPLYAGPTHTWQIDNVWSALYSWCPTREQPVLLWIAETVNGFLVHLDSWQLVFLNM